MDRRGAVRTAALTVFGMAMQQLDIAAIQSGVLQVKMDDWQFLSFEYRGKIIAIPASEVFTALEEAYGSAPKKGKK